MNPFKLPAYIAAGALMIAALKYAFFPDSPCCQAPPPPPPPPGAMYDTVLVVPGDTVLVVPGDSLKFISGATSRMTSLTRGALLLRRP